MAEGETQDGLDNQSDLILRKLVQAIQGGLFAKGYKIDEKYTPKAIEALIIEGKRPQEMFFDDIRKKEEEIQRMEEESPARREKIVERLQPSNPIRTKISQTLEVHSKTSASKQEFYEIWGESIFNQLDSPTLTAQEFEDAIGSIREIPNRLHESLNIQRNNPLLLQIKATVALISSIFQSTRGLALSFRLARIRPHLSELQNKLQEICEI